MVLVGFFLFFGIIALWSVATPKYASPDEPAHAIKAAANAHGEFRGTPHYTDQAPYVGFKVPATLLQGDPHCLIAQPAQSAACLTPWTTKAGTAEGLTYVAGYPPIYYVLVGLPTLITNGPDVLLWMRLVSAGLSALFLTVAFIAASRVRRGRWTVAGVAVAASPMALFLAGTVNPSGFEISAALAVWCCLLALVTNPPDRRNRWLVIWSTISASVFVQIRGLSPLWLAVIALTMVALVGWRRIATLLRRADLRFGLGIFAVCATFALVWIFTMGSLRIEDSLNQVDPDASNWEVLRAASHIGLEIKQLIGVFGWLDTFMPSWCYLAWEAILVLLAVGVLLRRELRKIGVLMGIVGVTIGLPILLAYLKAREHGIVGQGRDFLPMAVGAPILGAYAIAQCHSSRKWLVAASATIGTVVGAVQLAGFVQALHRYRTGVNAPILAHDAPWGPPIPALFTVAAFAVLQVAVLAWWMSLPRLAQRDDDPIRSTPPGRTLPVTG